MTARQYLRETVSMSARLSLVRFCTRSSRGASPAKCSIRSSALSSAASSSNSGLSSSACVHVRNVDECERLVAAAERHAQLVDGGPVLVFRSPAMSVLPLACSWSRSSTAAATHRGDDRVLTTPAAAKAPICARNWVKLHRRRPRPAATVTRPHRHHRPRAQHAGRRCRNYSRRPTPPSVPHWRCAPPRSATPARPHPLIRYNRPESRGGTEPTGALS